MTNASGQRRWFFALAALYVMMTPACGEDFEQEVAVTRGELLSCAAPGCKEFTDITGTIKIRVRTCGYVSATGTSGSRTAVATCAVDRDAGYVLVGGGAEIEGQPTPGALLKSSIPDPTSLVRVPQDNYTRWLARSAEYAPTSTIHRLRAYSIGLHLVGLSADELGQNLLWADGVDGTGPPTVQVVPAVNILLGGGGTVLPYESAMFLTASEPYFEGGALRGWLADARTNGTGPNPSQPKAYAVSMDPCPLRANGTVWGCLGQSWLSALNSGSGGYIVSQEYESPGAFTYMMTTVGGNAYWTATARRFLTDLIPTYFVNGTQTQGVTAWSKNTNPAAGSVLAAMVEVRRP